MAFSRRLGVVGILGISWFVAIGCGDDDGTKSSPGDGGEAGEAPVGGKAASGGSANNAGKGGVAAAGKGGSGGSGGTSTTAGTAGDAGAGQVAGAGGEATMGGATAAGAGGAAAGAGGEGGVPAATALKCGASCGNDDDCIRGQDDSQKCNLTSHRCEQPVSCAVDAECQPVVSFWSGTCASDAECADGLEWCIGWAGAGYCAPIPDPEFPDFPCSFGVPTTLPRFGTAGNVSVCANPDPRCFDGQCLSGCGDTSVGGCELGNGDTCSPTTGLCECASGTECARSGVCGADNHCTDCATDDDCKATVQQTGLDICIDGKCGCSAASVCPDVTASATPVCE